MRQSCFAGSPLLSWRSLLDNYLRISDRMRGKVAGGRHENILSRGAISACVLTASVRDSARYDVWITVHLMRTNLYYVKAMGDFILLVNLCPFNPWMLHAPNTERTDKLKSQAQLYQWFKYCMCNWGRVAQRITSLTTNQQIAGSNPAVVDNPFENYNLWTILSTRPESSIAVWS